MLRIHMKDIFASANTIHKVLFSWLYCNCIDLDVLLLLGWRGKGGGGSTNLMCMESNKIG